MAAPGIPGVATEMQALLALWCFAAGVWWRSEHRL
jgi:hypothetical protein